MGAGFKQKFLGLCLPPLAFALLDGGLTLAGQGDIYWSNFATTNEAGPAWAALLQAHPLAFLLGALAWCAALCGLVLVLPPTLALILSIAITFGHTLGAGSWLFEHFAFGYQLRNGYYLASACLLGLGIRHAASHGALDRDDALALAPQTRWQIGAGIFAVAVLAFLVPWR